MIFSHRFILLCCLFFLVHSGGCGVQKQQMPPAEATTEDSLDSSCSYFYFLWGSNAEYDERYEEALEAYEKASICDPQAEYIAEKIPVLLIQLGRLQEAASWLEKYIDGRPQKTVQRFMLARLKIEEGKEDEAIALYREALSIEPENNNIRLRLGLLYSQKGQFEMAEQIFRSILERNEDSYFATLYLARMYTKTGQLDKAEVHYRQALQLNWSKDLSYEIADFFNLRKEFNKAQEVYQTLLEKDERDERAALGMVQTYLFLQEGESALEELKKIRTFGNNPERIDLVRSQILINLGYNSRAKEVLEDLLKATSLTRANYLMGIILYEESNYSKAHEILEKIPPTAPEFSDAVMLRLRMLEESGQSATSISLLRKILASEESRQSVFYSWLAAIYQEQGEFEKAAEVFQEGLKIYNEDQSLLYESAILEEKTGNHQKAMQLMEKILSFNLNHADALNFIGYSWADHNIKLEKAYQYIRKALEIKPNSGYILDSLGWVYYRLGEFDKARDELEKAIILEPEDPYIFEHLGDTYKALENTDKALYYYGESLKLRRDGDQIKTIQQKIDSIND